MLPHRASAACNPWLMHHRHDILRCAQRAVNQHTSTGAKGFNVSRTRGRQDTGGKEEEAVDNNLKHNVFYWDVIHPGVIVLYVHVLVRARDCTCLAPAHLTLRASTV